MRVCVFPYQRSDRVGFLDLNISQCEMWIYTYARRNGEVGLNETSQVFHVLDLLHYKHMQATLDLCRIVYWRIISSLSLIVPFQIYGGGEIIGEVKDHNEAGEEGYKRVGEEKNLCFSALEN